MLHGEVCINDVSLRDGIQNEKQVIPLEIKLRMVEGLRRAGVKNLQVASFVNPHKVPQMRDIETFIDRLPAPDEETVYSGLVLNERGLERCQNTSLQQVDLSLSCNDAHSVKNTGLSLTAAKVQVVRMIAAAKKSGLSVRVGLQCVFGSNELGNVRPDFVVQLCSELTDAGCDYLSLADSTGQAIPSEVTAMVHSIQAVSARPLILHLHDTRGLGLANLVAGYEAGVRSFDASLGGVGGCPFIVGATGNIASEDAVYLFDRLGVYTGISLAQLVPITALLESVLQYPLPGKVFQLMNRKPIAARLNQEIPQSEKEDRQWV